MLMFKMVNNIISKSDMEEIHAISTHPVHILNDLGEMSPSSFIPFCDFGNNMSAMGISVPELEYPVCNKFQPILLKGQMCYQVDVSDIAGTHDAGLGLTFIMDYNTERMFDPKSSAVNERVAGLYDMQNKDENEQEAMIYIHTLGEKKGIYNHDVKQCVCKSRVSAWQNIKQKM